MAPPPFLPGPRDTAALYARMTAIAGASGGYCTVLDDSGIRSHARSQPLKYLRITKPGGGSRQAVLIVSGMHAREWAPPDAVLQFAEYLIDAGQRGASLDLPAIRGTRFQTGSGGVPGPDAVFDLPAHRISSNEVSRVLEKLEVFIVPTVNPDGRDYTMDSAAGPLARNWRKNNPPPPGTPPAGPPARGANLNGNFPVPRGAAMAALPSMREALERYYGPAAGLGTGSVNWSNDPTDWDVYGGAIEASENETRFVQWIIVNKHIRFYMDVHSAAHLISYPWAMEKNGADPTQAFTVAGWNSTPAPPTHTAPAGHPGGRDGVLGNAYNEYVPDDPPYRLRHTHLTVTRSMRDAIRNAAGGNATARERSTYNDFRRHGAPDWGHVGAGPFDGSIAELIYAAPASGMDWVFGRQFADPTLAPLYGFAFECGDTEEGGFWPLYGNPAVPSDPTIPGHGHQFNKIEREVVIGSMELLKFAASWRPATASRGCYVATAAYGSSLHPEIQFVIQLRERELRNTRIGRKFLDGVEGIYERIGPPLARAIRKSERLRGITRRGVVQPLIGAIRACERATRRIRSRERRVAAFVAMLTSILVLGAAAAITLLVLAIWAVAHV